MATHCGLGRAIRVLKGETSRGTLLGWRKEVIVDVLMSLAIPAGAIPGLPQHLEAAHRLAVASPANGGGMEAAMAFLKNGGESDNFSLVTNTHHDDSGGGVVDNDDQGEPSDTTDQQSSSADNCPSQPTASDGNGSDGPKLCRSNWKGIMCTVDNCQRIHKEFCLQRACYPTRDPDCLKWHPRSWAVPSLPGNGNKGNGQPTNKAASSKVKARQKDSILSRENRLLKQEIALYKERSRFQIRKHHKPTVSKPTTYRDAVVSGLPQVRQVQLPQHPPTHPPASQLLQGTSQTSASISSATALPANLLAAIQLAVETALSNRNPL